MSTPMPDVRDLRAEFAEPQAGSANGSRPDGEPAIVIEDVEAESVEWLWRNWLPFRKLVLLDGDPGCGKSTLSLDLAARITTASPMPDGDRPARPRGVLVISAEDDVADTIRPRLAAAGADLSRVFVPDLKDAQGHARLPLIPDDVEVIAELVRAHDVALVVLDPFVAFLGTAVVETKGGAQRVRLNANSDQDVRQALAALAEVVGGAGACVLLLRHLNKQVGVSTAMYRGGGSIGIIGACRVGMLAARHPEDVSQADEETPPERRRAPRMVLSVTKSNLARRPDALMYTLRSNIKWDVAQLQWEGVTSLTSDELLRPHVRRTLTKEQRAEALLTEELADEPRPGAEITKKAKGVGLSDSTVRRARASLGVIVTQEHREGQAGSVSMWALPVDDDEESTEPEAPALPGAEW